MRRGASHGKIRRAAARQFPYAFGKLRTAALGLAALTSKLGTLCAHGRGNQEEDGGNAAGNVSLLCDCLLKEGHELGGAV